MLNFPMNSLNPARNAGNLMAANTSVATSRVIEKGVTRFYFNPPLKLGALTGYSCPVHKAEIIDSKDSQYISINIYASSNFYSCIVSRDGKIMVKESTGFTGTEGFKKIMNSVFNIIDKHSIVPLTEKELNVTDVIFQAINNEKIMVKNETGKEQVIRNVYMPERPGVKDESQTRYLIVSSEGKVKRAVIDINKNVINFTLDEESGEYFCSMDNKVDNGNLNFRRSLSKIINTSFGESPDASYRGLSKEDKKYLLETLSSILEQEHNQQKILILNTIKNSIKL